MRQKNRTNLRKKELIEAKLKLSEILETYGQSLNCEMCYKSAHSDHHIIKKATDNYKFNSDVNNLIRLCFECHNLFHAYDSDKLIKINKNRFNFAMDFLEANEKFITLSKFGR